jgi:hypothetical protein
MICRAACKLEHLAHVRKQVVCYDRGTPTNHAIKKAGHHAPAHILSRNRTKRRQHILGERSPYLCAPVLALVGEVVSLPPIEQGSY